MGLEPILAALRGGSACGASGRLGHRGRDVGQDSRVAGAEGEALLIVHERFRYLDAKDAVRTELTLSLAQVRAVARCEWTLTVGAFGSAGCGIA